MNSTERLPGLVRLGLCAGPAETGRPARITDGAPVTSLWNEYGDNSGRLFSGIWSSTAGSWQVDYTEEEVCVILEGRIRLTAADGIAEDFGPGDSFVIPSGFRGTWTTLEPVRKLYVIYEPPAA
ncbi:cupin domain-containing protein [Zavarzinia compransoris]|uniref:cupin domain-containing protein n=1 Tax=Zavarzinia compransoris TaxID=1264899 RepID=UPI0010DCCE55|nr:cupin domain-containing protein [Zavarzinia compransoris]TDP48159.1 hypothetical protein DES42_102461 [Zavarzinia compransoris]